MAKLQGMMMFALIVTAYLLVWAVCVAALAWLIVHAFVPIAAHVIAFFGQGVQWFVGLF